jgi:DNA-binding response OmpR family regulator
MEPSAHALVVSPDRTALRTVEGCVAALGHRTSTARSLVDGQRLLSRAWIDLLCLDSLLPRDDTEHFWRCVAGDQTRTAPAVLFIAPPSTRLAPGPLPSFYRSERHGLVVKPIVAADLSSEVMRLLAERPRPADEEVLRVGTLTLDCRSRRLVFPDGASLLPTPTEFRLLRCLMEHGGDLVSTEALVEAVWNYPAGTGGSELVRAHVSNLRRKLREQGRDPQVLLTVPYRGYCVTRDGSQQPEAVVAG